MKAELKRKKIEFWGLWCWWCKWLLLRESHFLPPVLSVWSVGRGEKRGVIKNSPSPAWGVFRKESLLNQGKSLSLLETLLDSFLSVHEEQMCLSHVKGKKQSTQGWGGRGWQRHLLIISWKHQFCSLITIFISHIGRAFLFVFYVYFSNNRRPLFP